MPTPTEIIAVWAEGYSKQALSNGQHRVMGVSSTNSMPWPHSHADLQQFTRDTAEHVLIMGRKTFESLPKLMTEGVSGRITTQHRPMIVLTRDPAWAFVKSAEAFEQGLHIQFGGWDIKRDGPAIIPARLIAYARAHYPKKSIAVIGGPSVIELFRAHYDRLLITWHDTNTDGFEGDVPAPFSMHYLVHEYTHDQPPLTLSRTVRQHEYLRA